MAHTPFRAKPALVAALVAALIAVALGLAGCNTVKGLGKDIEKAGEKTQEAATKVSNKI